MTLDELDASLPKHTIGHPGVPRHPGCRICEIDRLVRDGSITKDMANQLVERDERADMATYDRMNASGAIDHMRTNQHDGIKQDEHGFVCVTCSQTFPVPAAP